MNMPGDPTAVQPPDDSGSDTFIRYVYQAEVVVPICINCAFDGEALSIIAEHIEDIAIEQADRWRFVQIKTRDAQLGPWRLAHLLEEGGGLHSLLRSHKVLTDVDCSLELFLEGAIFRGDLIRELTIIPEQRGAEVYAKVADRLHLSLEDCKRFLDRVRVVPNQPSRSTIVDRNIRVLGARAPHLPMAKLHELHDRIVGEVIKAMSIERQRDEWPQCIIEPMSAATRLGMLIEAKRLSRERLRVLVPELSQEITPLLKRIAPAAGDAVSDLVLKLAAGGATREIIHDAISLRANAAARYYEEVAGDLLGDERVLEDVRERLRIYANALLAKHKNHQAPAIAIWNELLHIMAAQVGGIDRRGLFNGDPFLLIGELCELSDQCIIEWGRARA